MVWFLPFNHPFHHILVSLNTSVRFGCFVLLLLFFVLFPLCFIQLQLCFVCFCSTFLLLFFSSFSVFDLSGPPYLQFLFTMTSGNTALMNLCRIERYAHLPIRPATFTFYSNNGNMRPECWQYFSLNLVIPCVVLLVAYCMHACSKIINLPAGKKKKKPNCEHFVFQPSLGLLTDTGSWSHRDKQEIHAVFAAAKTPSAPICMDTRCWNWKKADALPLLFRAGVKQTVDWQCYKMAGRGIIHSVDKRPLLLISKCMCFQCHNHRCLDTMGWAKELETVNINEMVIGKRVNKQHGLFLIDFYPSRLLDRICGAEFIVLWGYNPFSLIWEKTISAFSFPFHISVSVKYYMLQCPRKTLFCWSHCSSIKVSPFSLSWINGRMEGGMKRSNEWTIVLLLQTGHSGKFLRGQSLFKVASYTTSYLCVFLSVCVCMSACM